jgi:hypothetical protein
LSRYGIGAPPPPHCRSQKLFPCYVVKKEFLVCPHCLSVRLLNSLLLVSSLSFTVNSFAADDGTWTYYIDGTNATVTGCVVTCDANLTIYRRKLMATVSPALDGGLFGKTN